MAYLTQLCTMIMNNSFLAGIFYDKKMWEKPEFKRYEWLQGIVEFIDQAFIPMMIILGAVGGVWCIYLGVNLARAETADKAQEAKKRLINVVIAIVAAALLVFLLALFVSNIPTLFG